MRVISFSRMQLYAVESLFNVRHRGNWSMAIQALLAFCCCCVSGLYIYIERDFFFFVTGVFICMFTPFSLSLCSLLLFYRLRGGEMVFHRAMRGLGRCRGRVLCARARGRWSCRRTHRGSASRCDTSLSTRLSRPSTPTSR